MKVDKEIKLGNEISRANSQDDYFSKINSLDNSISKINSPDTTINSQNFGTMIYWSRQSDFITIRTIKNTY